MQPSAAAGLTPRSKLLIGENQTKSAPSGLSDQSLYQWGDFDGTFFETGGGMAKMERPSLLDGSHSSETSSDSDVSEDGVDEKTAQRRKALRCVLM